MKKIEAVIAPLNIDAVRKELERRGIRCGLTAVDVQHTDSEKSGLFLLLTNAAQCADLPAPPNVERRTLNAER